MQFFVLAQRFVLTILVIFVFSNSVVPAAAPWGNPPANEIWFHPNNRPHYPFANFYETDANRDAQRYPAQGFHNAVPFANLQINLAGIPPLHWRSSEHFFQAIKFLGQGNLAQLCQRWNTMTPGEVFAEVRGRPGNILAQWHNVKLYIMYTAIKAKFSQNAGLRALLLQTNDSWIVEHVLINHHQPQGDHYWGDTNNGHNYLGKILMLVRKELSGAAHYPATWDAARLNEAIQAERDILAHQQAWFAAGLPAITNHYNEPLDIGAVVTLDGANPPPGKLPQPAPAPPKSWLKQKLQDHPVLVPAIAIATAAGIIEIAWNGKNSIFLSPFKSNKKRPILQAEEHVVAIAP